MIKIIIKKLKNKENQAISILLAFAMIVNSGGHIILPSCLWIPLYIIVIITPNGKMDYDNFRILISYDTLGVLCSIIGIITIVFKYRSAKLNMVGLLILTASSIIINIRSEHSLITVMTSIPFWSILILCLLNNISEITPVYNRKR